MEDKKQLLCSLISIDNLKSFGNEEALNYIGRLDNLSAELQSIDGLNKANTLAEELLKRHLSPQESSTLNFYWANIWSDLRRLKTQNTEDALNWEQEEIEQEIIHLRLSIKSGLEIHSLLRKCQILTNLGNTLNSIGRFVEAIETWNRALEIDHEFGMALGNRGKGYFHYAQTLYDIGHKAVFFRHAHHDLKKALELPLHEDARAGFNQLQASIEQAFPRDSLKGRIALPDYSLGTSQEEIEYRSWCLENRLFLNPLNDLGPHSIAAKDILYTPNITVKAGSGAVYQRFANQLKQEYVTARYLLFKGLSENGLHYYDKAVYLFDTFDNPCLSASSEMIKVSYRISYSLFDKIALFMNHYMNLKIAPGEVMFKTFWYHDKKKTNGLRDEFKSYVNWPFRGLFWLSKDLFEDKKEFKNSIEPEAYELSIIRNFLEHKYLHLYGDCIGHNYRGKEIKGFSHAISIEAFQKKTLKVIKMTRAAIIYLLLGIHIEECKKSGNYNGKKTLAIELPLLHE